MYKLIAIDLDDTLLNDDHEITLATKQALAAAAEQGVIVTIATGRMYASAAAIARDLNMNVPLITYQGALIKNMLDGEVLYERNVPAEISQRVYTHCLENNLHLQGYYNDELYVREDNDKILAYSQLSKIPYIIEPDFAKVLEHPQSKLVIIDDPAKLDKVAELYRSWFGDTAHIVKSKPHFLEIMHPEGTKGSALRYLANHFGCTIEETIGIGDSWNDHDLVEAAGLGVAMGNAIDDLKEVANYITSTNNEEGVKQVIDQFVLHKQ
jgi:Cof subfamily protein (haloacid dehalogenase superfamily)